MRTCRIGLIAFHAAFLAAQPGIAEEGFSFYGFLNPAIVSVDDGVGTKTAAADNSHAPSRIGIWWKQSAANGMVKFNFETALGFRGTKSISQTTTPDLWNWDKTNLRKVEVIYETENAGTFYLGQGSMATDRIVSTDFSGTGLTTYNGIGDTAGGYFFRTSAGALSAIKLGSVYPNFDGFRKGRIRYDTPSLSGLVLSASVGTDILQDNVDNVLYDLAARYRRDAGDMSYLVTAGYLHVDINGGGTQDQYAASFSGLHKPTGLNFSVASRKRDDGAFYVYGKLGVKRDFFAVGSTNMAMDYYQGQNILVTDDASASFGVGVVQELDDANMELYLSYRTYSYSDNSPTSYLDAHSYMFGGRWSF